MIINLINNKRFSNALFKVDKSKIVLCNYVITTTTITTEINKTNSWQLPNQSNKNSRFNGINFSNTHYAVANNLIRSFSSSSLPPLLFPLCYFPLLTVREKMEKKGGNTNKPTRNLYFNKS
jgi:hypothetical protein